MTNQESLDFFEESLKRLKSGYDLFFMGARKLPPTQERRRLDALVHEIAKQHIRDNGMRFRYNTLLGRYNQFRELWNRLMREKEEGPADFRKRNALMSQRSSESTPQERVNETSSDPGSYVRVGTNGTADAMLDLFMKIDEASKQLGKSAALTLQQVTEMVSKQADTLRTRYKVQTIAFRVDTTEGKIKLKAKPVQE